MPVGLSVACTEWPNSTHCTEWPKKIGFGGLCCFYFSGRFWGLGSGVNRARSPNGTLFFIISILL